MEKILLDIILAVLLGWMAQEPFLNSDYGEEAGEEWVQLDSRSRGVFSAYIVGGVDCMDDGSYDHYVETQIKHLDPEAKPIAIDQDERFPIMFFDFMGLDLTDYINGSSSDKHRYYHKAFCTNEFYMEYPYDWYVGSTNACPLTFVPEWEEEASGKVIQDWAEYIDENLRGKTEEVQTYIEGGGINHYMEEAMGKPVTEEYEWVLRESDSDWLLIYDLKKEDMEAAEVIVWCNLGKFNVRNWDVELTVNPEEDYGRILVFREWKEYDFSSKEAIKEYVGSGPFLYDVLGTALEENVKDQIISFETEDFRTFYHEFICVDVGIQDIDTMELTRQATVYIPVTESYQSNWVVVFETFPGSRQKEGVGNRQVRERIMSTFVVLPYYHEVKPGENLSMIAEYYGEDPNLAYEIAAYKPAYKDRHIEQPDLIYPGQKVEIPLGVLFRKIHH